jgi:predicted phage terminase large subunit-like protein
LLDIADISLDQITAEKLRRSLFEFAKHFWPVIDPNELKAGWYFRAVCDHLQHAVDFKRLLICLPPGSAKSILTQIMYPAWKWTHDPTVRFLCCTHGKSLSTDFQIRCRRLMQSPEYQKLFGDVWQFEKDQNNAEKFANNRGGSRQACSVESGVIGHRAEQIIFDDPNDIGKIDHASERDKVWVFWCQVLSSRVNTPVAKAKRQGKDARIIIQQRCHPEDLSGRLIATDSENDWTKLILPMEYDGKRKCTTHLNGEQFFFDQRTRLGELLFRHISKTEIPKLKREKGLAVWQAQYNQDPRGSDGAIFSEKDFRYYTAQGDNFQVGDKLYGKSECWRFATVDLALGEKTSRDYTVIAVWAVTPGYEILLLDCNRGKIRGSEVVPLLVDASNRHNLSYTIIEDTGFQRLIIQEAKMAGLPVKPYHPTSDKVARSYPAQIRFENHEIYFPTEAPWLQVAQDELLAFPKGSNDDVVDCLSLACIATSRYRPTTVEEVSEQDRRKAEEERQKQIWLRGMLMGLD